MIADHFSVRERLRETDAFALAKSENKKLDKLAPPALTAKLFMDWWNANIQREVQSTISQLTEAINLEFKDQQPSAIEATVEAMTKCFQFRGEGRISIRTARNYMHELSLEWRRTRGKNGIYADGKLRKVTASFDSAGHEREDVVEYRAAKLPSFLHVWFNSEVFLWDPSTERFQELHRDILKQPDWKPKYVLVFQDESIVRNLFLYICYYA
jgi:hypothetical protein